MNIRIQCKQLLIASILLLTFFSNTLAQNVGIKWGIEQPYLKRGILQKLKVVKADENFVYYYTESSMEFSYKYYLVKHDRKTGLSTTVDINLEFNEYKLDLMDYYFYDNQFHVFTSYLNKKINKVFVFHESYNFESFDSNNDINKVAEIDYEALSGGKSSSKKEFFIQLINNQILLRYSCETHKNKVFGMEIFDKSIKSKWKNSSFAETESGVNYESEYCIDNDGNVYALQRNFENEKDVDKHFDRSRLWVVCYPNDGGPAKSVPLVLKGDNFITKGQLVVNKSGEVICAGLYSNPATVSAVGCFSFLLEPKLTKIKSVNNREFSLDFLTKGKEIKESEKSVKSFMKKKDFEEGFAYLSDSTYMRSDGGFSLVFEKKKIIVVERNNGPTTWNYYFDDLFVLTYNADGTIRWVQKIPKYEYVYNYGKVTGGYFASIDKNDNLNFAFNIVHEDKAADKAKTVEIKLDKDGNEKFRELESNPDIALIVCPKYFYKLDDRNWLATRYYYKTMFIGPPATTKNKITFGEIKLY